MKANKIILEFNCPNTLAFYEYLIENIHKNIKEEIVKDGKSLIVVPEDKLENFLELGEYKTSDIFTEGPFKIRKFKLTKINLTMTKK